jgi:multidrug efflux system outer membrane protein
VRTVLGIELGSWDYLTFATILLTVSAVVAAFVWLAGLPGRVAVARRHLDAEAVKILGWAGAPAAFRREESARLALLPGFSVSLGGGRLGSQVLSLLQLKPWLASASIDMSVPLYEGGERKARLEIATAQHAEAVAAYGAAVLAAFREIENALANEHVIARRLPYTQTALADRTNAVRIAILQCRAGRRDLLGVSSIQADQGASQADVVRARSLQRTNRISLYLALGGGFEAGS